MSFARFPKGPFNMSVPTGEVKKKKTFLSQLKVKKVLHYSWKELNQG